MVLVKQNDNKNNSPIFQMSCSSVVVFSLAFTASSAWIAIPLGCGQITPSIWRLLNYNYITDTIPSKIQKRDEKISRTRAVEK